MDKLAEAVEIMGKLAVVVDIVYGSGRSSREGL